MKEKITTITKITEKTNKCGNTISYMYSYSIQKVVIIWDLLKIKSENI